ncbi:helix-turn-helix domain-containing protein [Paenibacillus alginolyticus]|uniref:helix-turn-helix domain-containing protein n=1 Tax=Paenibacillus alginolyticus TaxID=59839 RepID=UPI0004288696|nr:helix-turn-helix domain-containing protein [Paenibacillus alginolyticus]MCY9664891.1 helix-turn-helix domain-containing protein [Paenibacillus alginolyticus]
MDIMTTEQAGKLWGVTPRRISELCRDGRIKSSYKIGASWVMPADTQKPQDARIKSGKYRGYKRPKKQDGGNK